MVPALRNVGGGLIASLLLLASAFSNGVLIFTGSLQPFLGQGVAAALITTAVTTIFVALTSNFLVPYPVVAGFLAATGWLIMSGAIRMATGMPLSRSTLGSFAEPHAVLLLGLTMLWAATLCCSPGVPKNPLTVPLALVAAILLTHALPYFTCRRTPYASPD